MARWVLLAGAAEAPQWWAQRPADGLWGGLWDLPMGPPSEALAAWLQEVRAVEGPAVRHVLTHRRVDATLWRVPPGAAKPRPDWLDPYDTWWEGGPALPPHSRLMQRLREEASQGTLPLG
jgi:adenine-specific DNA glycosylase